jgi:phage-related protein
MSNNVFPSLPGLDINVEREVIYRDTTHEVQSGKEYRTRWWSTPRYRYKLKFSVLRNSVNAPAPWAAYSEIAILLNFFDVHAGSWDSFLYNDPYDGTQVRVRFEQDSLPTTQVTSGIWECSFSLITVK